MSLEELCRFLGQVVTIFTTSGGTSGCGFTGVLLRVNPCYVTLVNRLGSAPKSPFDEEDCDRMNGRDCRDGRDRKEERIFIVGSICDIPVDKIAAFCHNAL